MINDIELWEFDEPVVSHKEPGAADHISVHWDVFIKLILSTYRK